MPYKIIKVHSKKPGSNAESDIDRVLLSNGEEEAVKMIVRYINDDMNYYFVAPNRIKGYVEVVYSTEKGEYIRTRTNSRLNSFNLTHLPHIS